jgi:sec-independent protein translocase protein TatB
MLDIGWSELLVIAVVAIVVVGPKDLPPMLRALGRTVSKMRKMAGEFQGQFNEALKEAELDDVKKSFDELRGLNPINDLKDSLNPLSGPVAKPAPAPVPPPSDQPAQPMTVADIEPTPAATVAPAETSAVAPVDAVSEKPAPKPRAPRKTAASTDGEPAKPRASRAKAAASGGEGEAPAKPRKTKSADAGAPRGAEPQPAAAAVTEEPTT